MHPDGRAVARRAAHFVQERLEIGAVGRVGVVVVADLEVAEDAARAGVVINPATPIDTLDEALEIADFVLLMSVNPGFGGQKFLPNSIAKVTRLARKRQERGLLFPIEIDGGIVADNVTSVVNAGVEWLVAGSSIFQTVNPAETFLKLQKLAREAQHVLV